MSKYSAELKVSACKDYLDGKGYGKQILLWAIKNMQTQRPILHVAGWNERAIDLYKKVGFEIIETIEI